MAIIQHTWAKTALPDPSTYYGGYKEPRLLSVGGIKRALSDRMGNFETATFDVVVSDHDRLLRGLMGGNTSKWITNKTQIVRMISDPDRRALLVPRIVAIGKITDYQPISPRQVKFTCEDYLATFTGLGQRDNQIPKRRITNEDFPNALSDVPADAEPIGRTYTDASMINLAAVLNHEFTPMDFTGYVQLSNEAHMLNLSGAIPNGGYTPPGHGADSGWISFFGYTHDTVHTTVPGNGAIGTWIYSTTDLYNLAPPGSFDITFASPDVAERLEAAVGGTPTVNNGSITVGLPVPIIYNDQAVNGVASNRGKCIPVYAGIEDVGGVDHHVFVVACHAVRAITQFYLEDSQQVINSPSVAGTGGPWLIPGYDAWNDAFGPTTYEDRNGRRYTVIYGRVGNFNADVAAGFFSPVNSEATRMALDIEGIESNGDGSGTLLTDGFVCYRHLIRNFLIGDYQSGAYALTGPQWPQTTVEVIDDDSFDDASAISATRISGGYLWAGIIGNNGEFLTVRDILQRANQSLDCFIGMSRNFQLMCKVMDLSPAALAAARPYNQVNSMFGDSFSVRLDPIENVVQYSYARDFGIGTWVYDTLEVSDAESIAAIDERKTGRLIEMWFVRNTPQAEDLAMRRLLWAKEPPRVVQFSVDINLGLVTELADIAAVTHHEGLTEMGWDGHPVWIHRHELNPDTMDVLMQGYDVARLYAGSGVLGDEDTASGDYISATQAERTALFYLADETTGEFSNGDAGHRLR